MNRKTFRIVFFCVVLGILPDSCADENTALRALHDGESYDLSTLHQQFDLIERRGDTADFRLQSLTRLVYDFADSLSPQDLQRIKNAFLGFKYWMDQPGRDSMCYWSENHQILFSTAEYLAGQRWPGETFTNDGKTGAEHRDMARRRVLA